MEAKTKGKGTGIIKQEYNERTASKMNTPYKEVIDHKALRPKWDATKDEKFIEEYLKYFKKEVKLEIMREDGFEAEEDETFNQWSEMYTQVNAAY